RLARVLRHDAQLRRLARPVAWLVERDLQHLRTVGLLIGSVPARVEVDARQRAFRLRRRHLEAIAAPVGLYRDSSRLVGCGVDAAASDLAIDGDSLVGPLAVLLVPLPSRVETEQRPRELAQ